MPGSPFDRHHWDFAPWSFWADATTVEHDEQRGLQQEFLALFPGSSIAERCFVSTLAAVQTDALVLGAGSYIAAYAYVTGTVRAGRDCTINPYAVVRGEVSLGDAVRIGAHTSILAFNHTMSDPDVEVFRQPLTTAGIRIGDDVWIGSNAVILDGVTIGSRSVIAAGAVVTRDVPAGAIVAGTPAVVKRWRVAPDDPLADRLADWGSALRNELPGILERSWRPDLRQYVDKPGAAPTVRAHCDAIELATTVLGAAPAQLTCDEHVARLSELQDDRTGLVAEFGAEPAVGLHDGSANYHVLCVGYALDVLGAGFRHPIAAVATLEPAELIDVLADEAWQGREWSFGAWVDSIGTAVHWNRATGVDSRPGTLETLLGWLSTHADPATGLWGAAAPDGDRLEIVNGFYRASRGSFAQFGMPVAHPERVVDTVLSHAEDLRHFQPELLNACNVLDVIHPLWLVGAQTAHRRDEVVTLARGLLSHALDLSVPGEGFGFAAPAADGSRSGEAMPGLQGTEMWIAIIWHLAQVAGLGDRLSLRPKGVHRPEAAGALRR